MQLAVEFSPPLANFIFVSHVFSLNFSTLDYNLLLLHVFTILSFILFYFITFCERKTFQQFLHFQPFFSCEDLRVK